MGMIAFSTVTFADVHSTTGAIKSISINDLRNLKGLDNAEQRYVVTLRLDSGPEKFFGLVPGKDGELSGAQQAMLGLLQEALRNRWKVTIRWESSVTAHASILSVTIPDQ
jgi:hypothetical protein